MQYISLPRTLKTYSNIRNIPNKDIHTVRNFLKNAIKEGFSSIMCFFISSRTPPYRNAYFQWRMVVFCIKYQIFATQTYLNYYENLLILGIL